MSFLTSEEAGSLKINEMILHVVGDGNFKTEKKRVIEHEEFFIERIRDTDVSCVYSFSKDSLTKLKLEEMATKKIDFEVGCQELSSAFSHAHKGNTRLGAFFIFELGCSDSNTVIYSLIKYDYREVIEQGSAAQGTSLRKIVKAFIADKRAIQKSALVRVFKGAAESEVSTTDRVKSSVEISDYFEDFLNVTRQRSDQELNGSVKDVLIQVLRDCKDVLPGGNFSQAYSAAVTILRGRKEINEKVIVDAVLMASGDPQGEEVVLRLQNATNKSIKKYKLTGLEFKPDFTVLKKPPTRKVKTTEGAVLIFPDNLTGTSIDILYDQQDGDIITIKTKKITEDGLLRDNAR